MPLPPTLRVPRRWEACTLDSPRHPHSHNKQASAGTHDDLGPARVPSKALRGLQGGPAIPWKDLCNKTAKELEKEWGQSSSQGHDPRRTHPYIRKPSPACRESRMAVSSGEEITQGQLKNKRSKERGRGAWKKVGMLGQDRHVRQKVLTTCHC